MTATWNIPRSHLTTTDRYSLPLSTVYGRIVLTAVLTPPPSPTSTRSILRILHTTGRRPYLEPSAVPVGDRLAGYTQFGFTRENERSLKAASLALDETPEKIEGEGRLAWKTDPYMNDAVVSYTLAAFIAAMERLLTVMGRDRTAWDAWTFACPHTSPRLEVRSAPYAIPLIVEVLGHGTQAVRRKRWPGHYGTGRSPQWSMRMSAYRHSRVTPVSD